MPPPNEKWIPFCLVELAEAESLPLSDVDSFIPFLTEKWPVGGRPHRVELQRDGRPNPRGTDGWVVFRVPPPEPDPTTTRMVTVDWAARTVRAVGITRRATRIHLTTRTDPAGMTVWVVEYTISEHGRENSFVTHHAAEAGARQLVANLLRDRVPGLSEAEVYSEELG